MQKLVKAFFLTSALSTAVLAMPAFAEGMTDGKAVESAEASRSMGTAEFTKRKGGPRNVVRSDSASRASPGLDDAATIKAYTLVTRSKDGKETRKEPTADTLKALKGEKKAQADTAAPEGAADPVFAEEGGRAISGDDNRIPVSNATKYPFATVGYLDAGHEASQTYWGCTATVVGPATIITAASCVYNHNIEGGWMEQTSFYPAINGEENIPWGAYGWNNITVFQGFIDDYDGTYDSIWAYDVAMIELDTPIGDTTTGWLGLGTYPDLGDFEANMISYNDDTTAWTQWRTSCDIRAEDVTEYDIIHDCDSDNNYSFGAPIYYYDPADKGRRVIALNMGGDQRNWALRLHYGVFDWLVSVLK